jgi:hypothetical protein
VLTQVRDSSLEDIRYYLLGEGSPGNKIVLRLKKKLESNLNLLEEKKKADEKRTKEEEEAKAKANANAVVPKKKEEEKRKSLIRLEALEQYSIAKNSMMSRIEQDSKFHLQGLLEKEGESRRMAEAAAEAERRSNELRSKLAQEKAEKAWRDRKESQRKKAASEVYQFIQFCAEGGYSNDEAIKRMIKNRADLVFAADDDGDTGAHLAAKNGKVSTLTVLVNEGANVNACNNDANTPLHFACHYGHVEIVKLLLKSGATVRAYNTMGKSPTDMMDSHISPTVMGQILSAVEGHSSFIPIGQGIGIRIPCINVCSPS